MNPMMRKALIGGGLMLATITGGAIGASFMGVASAQTNDNTTTTQPAPSSDAGTTQKHDGNCPDANGDGVPDAPPAGTTNAS